MIRFYAGDPEARATEALVQRITECLDQSKSVLWLVAGGSAIGVAVAVARRLAGHPRIDRLAVSLTDERYGDVGHPDSNWQQLLDAGLDLPGAELHPVVAGSDMETTAQAFETWLQQQFTSRECCIGLLGIGPDGHTSGILPHSPAVTAETLVAAYDGGAYRRITTTPVALVELDVAIVYAAGESKEPTLRRLQGMEDLAEQPAQVLKQIPEVELYNDTLETAL